VSLCAASPQKPARGYKIRGNGDVEFNDGIFRGHLDGATGSFSGHIEAKSGTLEAVTISDQATFSGRIFSDNFTVDYDPESMRRFPASGNYAANTGATAIKNAIYGFLGISTSDYSAKTVIADDGEINGKKIRNISFNTLISGVEASLIIRTTDGNQYYTLDSITGSWPFWVQLGTGGKKIMFKNLDNNAGGKNGTVYKMYAGRPGEYYVMVKDV
jgi:hypothetical protein